MSAIQDYFADTAARLADLERTQSSAIDAAATLGATAIAEARPIHIFDTGHLISHEFIARTGGLAAYTALGFGASVDAGNEWIAAQRSRLDATGERSAQLLVEWLFEQGTVLPGDLLVLSSVSGTNLLVVELAIQARARGIHVVAVTGSAFSAELTSSHSSGKRLFEVADVVLDNCVPYGDAALTIDGLDTPVAAWSGLAGAAMMWAVTAGIIAKSIAAGVVPSVFTSYNLPGGAATYAATRAHYRETGQ
ncbi:MAG: sugar isomerase domain-containing protein [Cellulomonas sp.]